MEHPGHPEMLAVQWHPERSPGSRFSINLAQWLSNRAESYARQALRS
jgi:gamma-glutamyl-gamma-aminobutyrate hydrolase PuuD